MIIVFVTSDHMYIFFSYVPNYNSVILSMGLMVLFPIFPMIFKFTYKFKRYTKKENKEIIPTIKKEEKT